MQTQQNQDENKEKFSNKNLNLILQIKKFRMNN